MSNLSSLKQQQTAVAKGPSPQATLMSFFEKNKGQLAMALPKHLNPDRMVRLAMTAFSQNKALRDCAPLTIFSSVVIASQMGLEIGVSGQGYLVPYKGKATFVPGWQGLVDLVSRSGRATVWTGAVFAGDEFDYALGDSPYVKHRPSGEDDPQYLTHVYAIGRVNGSEWPVIEVWPIKRVWKHRDRNNKVGKAHYSFDNPEMYARKVPLLQVIKYMPKSIELTNALNAEHAFENGKGIVLDGDFVRADDDQEDQAGQEQQERGNEGHEIDRETGEVFTYRAERQAEPVHQQDDQGSQPQSSMFGLEDALSAVRRGAFDEARDIARSLSDKDSDIVEQTISNQQKAGGARTRRQRDLE